MALHAFTFCFLEIWLKPLNKGAYSEHIVLLVRDIMSGMNSALSSLFMMADREYHWLHSIIKEGVLLVAIGDVENVCFTAPSICNGKEEPLGVAFGVYIVL